MALLRTFLNRFVTTDETRPAPIEPALGRPEPESVSLLRPLALRRQLLTVRVGQQPYQSLILALDIERKLLWLDDLFPRTASLMIGETVNVEHPMHHQLLSFSVPVAGWSASGQQGGIALPLPEKISIGPRRRWPRLDVFGWHPISARLTIPGCEPVSGEILNISAGGVRLSLSGDWRARLRHGDILPLCEFKVCDQIRIRCRVRVCAYGLTHRPWRQTRLSLAFEDIHPSVQQALAVYIERSIATFAHAA